MEYMFNSCSQDSLPSSDSCGVACAVTVARRLLQLALPCRTDAKPVALCSCLQHTVFSEKYLFLHFIQGVNASGAGINVTWSHGGQIHQQWP